MRQAYRRLRRQSRPGASAAEPALLRELRCLLAAMRRRYDHGAWWPARTRFEMMAGAILTQRTRWESAASAARRLGRAGLLRADRLAAAGTARVSAIVRPCGNHRAKGRRLVALARFLVREGGPGVLAAWPTPQLRRSLMSVHGIGPETADAILLYAYRRPVFVADAYALRFLSRVGALRRAGLAPRYAPVHERITQLLDGRAQDLADLHAVIVEHGKERCGARPRCADCFLARSCDYARRLSRRNRGCGR